jgi:ABC-type transporter Mla maintaining outer membrane lipid asymmetry permease subunit MlaE
VHGIPLEYLLVFPRLVAFPIASFCLTTYFVAIALGAGAIAAPLLLPDPGAFSMRLVLQTAGPLDVLLPAVKSAVFGVATALVCSAAGLGVGRSPREIPQAATRAVSASFVACLALNAVLSLAVLL